MRYGLVAGASSLGVLVLGIAALGVRNRFVGLVMIVVAILGALYGGPLAGIFLLFAIIGGILLLAGDAIAATLGVSAPESRPESEATAALPSFVDGAFAHAEALPVTQPGIASRLTHEWPFAVPRLPKVEVAKLRLPQRKPQGDASSAEHPVESVESAKSEERLTSVGRATSDEGVQSDDSVTSGDGVVVSLRPDKSSAKPDSAGEALAGAAAGVRPATPVPSVPKRLAEGRSPILGQATPRRAS